MILKKLEQAFSRSKYIYYHKDSRLNNEVINEFNQKHNTELIISIDKENGFNRIEIPHIDRIRIVNQL